MDVRRPHAARPARVIDHLLVALGVVSVSAVVLQVVVNQQAFLNFYYLPVAYASWRLGRDRGVQAAVASCGIVLAAALMNDSQFGLAGGDRLARWLDLGIWGAFLFLTAYAVGSLADRDESRLAQLRRVYQGVLEIMAKFIDSIDRSTENHSRRVAERTVEMARHLGVPETEIDMLRVAAYLHDIGKVDVSAEVLHKAARLSPEEMQEMARHVDHGTLLLERVGGLLDHAIPVVLYHHERWDGSGYKGLAGEAIPLGARILAVADTYDAIVADRPYREGRTHEQAVAILRSESGAQFDPRIVEVFIALYDTPAARDEAIAA